MTITLTLAHFFRFWLWLTTGMVTKEWAAIHRKHRARCETGDDLHSPRCYGTHCHATHHLLWLDAFLHRREDRNMETIRRHAPVKKTASRPCFGERRPVVDLQTLQAVIANRYDVLARYAATLQRGYRKELATQRDSRSFKELKRWPVVDSQSIPGSLCCRFDPLLDESRPRQAAHAMRQELTALWARSNASGEYLPGLLQDWCERTENSGICPLQELSARLRS